MMDGYEGREVHDGFGRVLSSCMSPSTTTFSQRSAAAGVARFTGNGRFLLLLIVQLTVMTMTHIFPVIYSGQSTFKYLL